MYVHMPEPDHCYSAIITIYSKYMGGCMLNYVREH